MKTSNKVGHCANCGSEHIEYGESNLQEEMLAYDYDCETCGEPGKEWYKLEYVESIKY